MKSERGRINLSGLKKPENQIGRKFNFRIKIVKTDLSGGDDFFDGSDDGFSGDSPIMYQNSGYISKLFFINNISGGILAKDKIEDMPERYKRFITFDNPSATDIVNSFRKELDEHAKREKIGQNVFYSRLSNPVPVSSPAPAHGNSKTAKNSDWLDDGPEIINAAVSLFSDIAGGSVGFENPVDFDGLDPDDFDGFEEFEDLDAFEEFEAFGDFGDFAEYASGEEVKDILHLNNYYNSDAYKLSKTEYDYSSPGDIILDKNGTFELRYNENEITDFAESYSQIFFDAEKKDIVTLRRKSFCDIWLTLEKGKRISIGQTGEDAGTVATATAKEIVNNMTADGGDMKIVYITEINGYPCDMISQTIYAEPVGD